MAVLREVQGDGASSSGEPGPSGFPTLGDLKAVNRAVYDDAGQPDRYALDQPSPLQSALEQERQSFEPSPEGLIHVAALLGHGIAQAQGFRDDNRRTAYLATKAFLDENDPGFLVSTGKPDHMLVRFLNQVVDNPQAGRPAANAETFERLLRRRLRARRRPQT